MTGGDWTDCNRPVLERYEEWKSDKVSRLTEMSLRQYLVDTAQLLHHLAAVLREAGSTGAPEFGLSVEQYLAEVQSEARDPETGEKVFP